MFYRQQHGLNRLGIRCQEELLKSALTNVDSYHKLYTIREDLRQKVIKNSHSLFNVLVGMTQQLKSASLLMLLSC